MTRSSTDSRHDAALAALRVAIGGIFAAHGAQKLFVYGIDGVTGAFGGMGIPMPGITGPLTGVVELLAGLALVVGLMTRLAGLGLAVIMLGAIGMVHIGAGFWAPNGVEFPLALMAGATTIALAGAGRFSLDAAIAARRN
ncbi:DoxX family protein [Pseudogemmatithrix spongiicola]|uniref:DoxX family protein n=1 Tax=Pseudogemmatithrix spongiicola TaxID=3062599 RepID=A0AA49Q5X3_9BACT|nr:DoxX family protein [Gemmatimonadaceae bacterium 'strain 138']WKW16314.1 DoxX family protein [Gemmatimonadaceae bacterium 'strain 318']